MKRLVVIALFLVSSSALQAETLVDMLRKKGGADVEYEGPLARDPVAPFYSQSVGRVPPAFEVMPPSTSVSKCQTKVATSIMKKRGYEGVRLSEITPKRVDFIGIITNPKDKKHRSEIVSFANKKGCPEYR
ncbi:hypothetical protein ACCS88_21050 [Rhizobium ruizarguesonis]